MNEEGHMIEDWTIRGEKLLNKNSTVQRSVFQREGSFFHCSSSYVHDQMETRVNISLST